MKTRPAALPLVDAAELRTVVPSVRAGARALRGLEKWAHHSARLPTTAEDAGDHAAALEEFAAWVDRLCPKIEPVA